MIVGACRLWLRLPENHSLKGKRQVVRSIVGQVKNRFDVAIAEVDDLDAWQIASLGLCCVGNNTQHVDELLSKVINFIEGQRLDIELVDYHTEIVHVLTDSLPRA